MIFFSSNFHMWIFIPCLTCNVVHYHCHAFPQFQRGMHTYTKNLLTSCLYFQKQTFVNIWKKSTSLFKVARSPSCFKGFHFLIRKKSLQSPFLLYPLNILYRERNCLNYYGRSSKQYFLSRPQTCQA